METLVYAARVKDKELLKRSSSGGAFTALSDVFLERGDAVVCAVYNYASHDCEYRLVATKKERDEAIGSKYVQSVPGNIFRQAEKWLKDNPGKKLLFVGTGCQAAGFAGFTEQQSLRDRTVICDIICHGSPSPALWKEYIGKLEKKHGKISFLTFKDKRNGWNKPMSLVIANDKEISIKGYKKLFTSNCTMRPCCHKCPYTKTERDTDITIGDYWHIEDKLPDFYDPMGNSLILIHSEKGKELFDKAAVSMDIMQSDVKACWQKNLSRPTDISPLRKNFWRDYKKHGIDYVVKKYALPGKLRKISMKIQKMIRS